MIPAVCNNYLQGGILLSGGSGDKIKNFPVAFPFVIVFGRSAYQAGTFRTGVGIQVIIITYIIRILAVIFTYF